ncbi:MAG: hypothetical protein VXW32_05230 [Myxococcota bacterium]|nr:hypothetical protein [Myxococcota bacterium]
MRYLSLVPCFIAVSCTSDNSVDTGTPVDTEAFEMRIDPSPEVVREPPTDFELVSEEYEAYADIDYVIQTWSLREDAPNAYASLVTNPPLDDDGQPMEVRPTFYVLRGAQADFNPDQAIVWFHGGAVADDSDFPETGVLPDQCHNDRVFSRSQNPFRNLQVQVVAALSEGWTVLFPRNDWCDGWMGLGPDDPYRTWHSGNYHLDRMLDFSQAGGLGFAFPKKVSLWGTSSGGIGALFWAGHRSGFHSVVTDSSPNNWIAYYRFDPEVVVSHFGGPPFDENEVPTEFYGEYEDASGFGLLESGKLNVPLFIAWNSMDTQISPAHTTSMLDVLDSDPSLLSGRWGVMDFNRFYPGRTWHVQTTASDLPAAYGGPSIVQFLKEHHLQFLEVEKGCGNEATCTLGMVVEAKPQSSETHRSLSNSGGLVAAPEAGEGILWERRVDPLFNDNQTVSASFAVAIGGVSDLDPSTVVGEIHVTDSSGTVVQEVLASDIYKGSETKEVPLSHRLEVLHQIQATTITFPFSKQGPTTLSWRHKGNSETLLDQVIFSTSWE